jgi:hypothetical protein
MSHQTHYSLQEMLGSQFSAPLHVQYKMSGFKKRKPAFIGKLLNTVSPFQIFGILRHDNVLFGEWLPPRLT